jgi:hypothetical protein
MAWAPKPRVLTLMLAWPEPFSVADPKSTAPSLKSTDPDGTPTADVTVAVKVTDWPTVLRFGAPVTEVEVLGIVAAFTT